MVKRNKSFAQIAVKLFTVLVTVLMVLWFVFSVNEAGNTRNDEERSNLESSIKRAAAACYAMEGAYPESLEYLETRYGIQIDYERYNVFYDVFAQNLMPEITVVEKNNEK